MVKKDVVEIKPGHPSYSEVDVELRRYAYRRFVIDVRDEAIEKFRELARALVHKGLKKGTLLMLGYEHEHDAIMEYFTFGVNRDLPTKTHLSLIGDFDQTLDTILERDETKKKHDGAYLFSPDGVLYHGGAGFSHHDKRVFRAYGYKRLYDLNDALGLDQGEGGFRLKAAVIHSMLFLNAEFASIVEKGSETRNYYAKNGRLHLIS